MLKFLRFSILSRSCATYCASLCLAVATFATSAAENLSLDDKEHLDVQRELSLLTIVMWTLIIGLLVFAYSIRYIARRTTQPCPWCMEFIKKTATVCPRCGKNLATTETKSAA